MIEDRSDLIEKVYKWLLRDQTTDKFITEDMVETYIQFCEAEINRELKILDLEDTETYTLSTDNDYVALPSGYGGTLAFQFDVKPFNIAHFPTRRAMKEQFGDDIGRPRGYTLVGSKIYFNCTPDSDYPMTLDYYKRVTALTDSNTDNVILQNHPDLYLYGSIRQALLNINDQKRLTPIATVYSNILERIKEDDKAKRMPGGGKAQARRSFG